MDLLKDWIGPRVHQALTEALEWKSRGSPAGRDGQDEQFEDDGNSLRVRMSKPEVVQITKIEKTDRPVQLWLSDSRTFLKVIIAAQAAERFERKEQRRVTEGTLGGLIQIKDYEITAQHYGPRKTKITMYILDFLHIGSDGSGSFGMPRPIECLEPIVELLEKLKLLRAREHPSSQSPASFKPTIDYMPSPTQTNSISSMDDNLDRSQAMLATQIPRLQPGKRLREGPLITHGRGASGMDKLDSIHSPEKSNGVPKRKGAPSALPFPTHGTGAGITPPQIGQQSASSLNKISNEENTQADTGPSPSRQEFSSKTVVSTAEELKIKKANDLMSLLSNTKPNRAPDQIANDASTKHDGISPEINVQESAAAQGQISSINKDLHAQATASAIATHNDHLKSPRSPFRSSAAIKSPSKGPKSPREFQRIARQSRRAQSRVNGREVRISKDQRTLLDRVDSWYPPEPGHRAPAANIPISILQDLNNQAERQVHSPQDCSQVSLASESPKQENWSNSASTQLEERASDSDTPVPSAEWPSSPPEPQRLPPDSSFISKESLEEEEAEEQFQGSKADTAIDTDIGSDHSPISERRQSQNSLSVTSDMPHDYGWRTGSAKSSGHTSPRRGKQDAVKPPAGLSYPSDSSSVDDEGLLSHTARGNIIKAVDSISHLSDAEGPTSKPMKPFETDFLSATTAPNPASTTMTDELPILLPSTKLVDSSQMPFQDSEKESVTYVSSQSIRNDTMPHSRADQSDSDSDLERSILYGHDKSKDAASAFTVAQESLTGATQPNEPVLQVNQTPYINDPSLELSSSAGFTSPVNGELNQEQESVVEGLRSFRDGNLRCEINSVKQSGESDTTSTKPTTVKTKDGFRHVVFSTGDPAHTVEETILPLEGMSSVVSVSTKPRLPPQSEALKRKASEPVDLSPNVTSRRKKVALGRTASDHGIPSSSVDPARNIRQQHFNDFLADKRRSSLAQSVESPDAPHGDDNNAMQSGFKGGPQSNNDISLRRPPFPSLTDIQKEPMHHSEDQQTIPQGETAEPANILNPMQMDSDFDQQSVDALPSQAQSDIRGVDVVNETRLEHLQKEDVSYPVADHAPKSEIAPWMTINGKHDAMPHVQVSSTPFDRDTEHLSEQRPVEASSTLCDPAPSLPQNSNSSPNRNTEEIVHKEIQIDKIILSKQTDTGPMTEKSENSRAEHAQPPTMSLPPTISEIRDQTPSRSLDLFNRFKATYPDYPGTPDHFAAMRKKLRMLWQKNQTEHPSLWDDFIIRHRVDYTQYLGQCSEEAEDPVPYEQFYRCKITVPKYMSSEGPVVTPEIIKDLLPPELANPKNLEMQKPKNSEPQRRSETQKLPEQTDSNRGVRHDTPPSESGAFAGRKIQEPSDLASTEATTENETGYSSEDSRIRRAHQNKSHVNRTRMSRSTTIQEPANSVPCADSRSSLFPPGRSPSIGRPTGTKAPSTRVPAPKTRGTRAVIDLTMDPEDLPVFAQKVHPINSTPAKQTLRSLPWADEDKAKSGIPVGTPTPRAPISTPIPLPTSHQRAQPTASNLLPSPRTVPKAIFAAFGSQKPPATQSSPASSQPKINDPASRPISRGNAQTKKSARRGPKVVNLDDFTDDEFTPFRTFARQYQAIKPGRGNSYAHDRGLDIGSSGSKTEGKEQDKRVVDPTTWEL